ncbi:MAG: ABC transporter ATP-binding protein [Firmicutes bacterium]|nr:ABC transporter ATP-binding protein [Bacillota bacterium]
MLKLQSVSVNYGGIIAVSGVSFEVCRGEIVAIVGSNGAGKSTILRAISALIRPSGGEITLDGARIDGMRPHEVLRMGVAHVPEGRLLFGKMSVKDNLLTGAFTLESREKTSKALEQVYALFPRLREREQQKSETLSGGEQQMLAIGRALMAQPKVLMLDEPSLGLMPLLVRQVLHFVKRVNESGTTVLLVEQNVRQALSLAHRAYVLQTGRIVAEGTGRELLNSEMVKRAYLGM